MNDMIYDMTKIKIFSRKRKEKKSLNQSHAKVKPIRGAKQKHTNREPLRIITQVIKGSNLDTKKKMDKKDESILLLTVPNVLNRSSYTRPISDPWGTLDANRNQK